MLKKIFKIQVARERDMVQGCLVINTYIRESKSAQLYQSDAISPHECLWFGSRLCICTDFCFWASMSWLCCISSALSSNMIIFQVIPGQELDRKKILKQPYKNVNGFQTSTYPLCTMEASQKKESQRQQQYIHTVMLESRAW